MKLTKRLLEAMYEALHFRLAGEIEQDPDDDAPKPQDYNDAADWVWDELKQRYKGTAKP